MFASAYESPKHKALSEPLLDLDDTEVSYDDDNDNVDEELALTESGGVCCCLPFDSNEDESYDDDRTCDSLVTTIVMPVLLLVQFGLNYYGNAANNNSRPLNNPPLAMTLSSITLFAVASILYKYSLRMSNKRFFPSCCCFMTVQLLPELWANAVLVTILVTLDVTAALQLLLLGNLVLAAFGVVRALAACCRSYDNDDKEDELDVSYYNGFVRGRTGKLVVVLPVHSCCGCTTTTAGVER